MKSEVITAMEGELVGRIDSLQALLAAQNVKIASLEEALNLALRAMDRFADVPGSME